MGLGVEGLGLGSLWDSDSGVEGLGLEDLQASRLLGFGGCRAGSFFKDELLQHPLTEKLKADKKC